MEVSPTSLGGASTLFNPLEVEKVPTGTCPDCEADVHVDTDADKGDVVTCDECGTSLEVVGLDPVELDIVDDDDEEDFDEEDEEDY